MKNPEDVADAEDNLKRVIASETVATDINNQCRIANQLRRSKQVVEMWSHFRSPGSG